MASTPNDCGLPSTSVLEIDEEAFDATLARHELSFNDEQTSIDGQYLGTIDDHEEELGNFPWTIDEAHGQYCEDYALLTEAIDALKMVNLERCGPDEAILRYAHAIEAVVNRIKIAGMMSIVTVDANGGIVVFGITCPLWKASSSSSSSSSSTHSTCKTPGCRAQSGCDDLRVLEVDLVDNVRLLWNSWRPLLVVQHMHFQLLTNVLLR